MTLEPQSEDDWEVLELNAQQAEASILKQVRIATEGMRFPLWLHGRTVITFLVVSTLPKRAVVQLVPGTEVAVAPKRRKKDMDKENTILQSSNNKKNMAKALVRLQDLDRRLFHKCDIKGVELAVALTCVAYIHPETAQKFSLDSLQLVTLLPRMTSKYSVNTLDSDVLRVKSTSTMKENNNGNILDKKEFRQAIVRLLISDSVAKGHVMIARSLRSYLRAELHSWVYLKGCCTDLKKDMTSFLLSPCYFKMLGQDKPAEKPGLEVFDGEKLWKPQKNRSSTHADAIDWSIHSKIMDTLSQDFPSEPDEGIDYQSGNRKGLGRLLKAWFCAQVDGIASISGMEVNSLILGKETLLHFEVKGCDFWTDTKIRKRASYSNGSIENRNSTGEGQLEFFYVMSISEDSVHGKKGNVYSLAFDESKLDNLGLELLERLKLGDPVSFYSPKESNSFKGFGSNASSLSWMGKLLLM